MEDTYFVITNSDGDTTVEEMTKQELIEAIEEGRWGRERMCLENIPENNDTNYWGESILIIKGKVVRPLPEQVVTKYTIE